MKIYPKHIEEYADKMIKVASEDPEANKDLDMDTFKKEICEKVLQKFLNNEDELRLSESEALDCVHYAIFQKAVKGLKEKGIVDTIEDENGEDIIFLTEKGKLYNDKI